MPVLELLCEGVMHTISLDGTPDFATIASAIQSIYQAGGWKATYLDEEQDHCTLVESTFEDFLEASEEAVAKEGQLILKLTVERTIGTATKQPAMKKAIWSEDKRDLEELVRELQDKPAAAASAQKKRKNKKKRKAAKGMLAEEQAMSSDHFESSDVADVEQPSAKEPEQHGMKHAMGRSVSCPLLGIPQGAAPAHDEAGWLGRPMVEAWPFVDGVPEWGASKGGCFPDDGVDAAPSLWPSTPDPTPPSTPRHAAHHGGQQQVVWMPVLVPMQPWVC